jgi:hypothetical protein
VEKHLRNLKKCGVNGVMTNWTLGGYPGGNMELFRRTPGQIAGNFGPRAAAYVRKGQKLLSRAFAEFPFHVAVLYCAPQNMGPANLLHAKPTRYKATMVGIPYDDVTSWRAIYPRAIFEKQFEKLCVGWEKGFRRLRKALTLPGARRKQELEELLRITTAVYCHFRTVCLQTAFVRLRGRAGRKISAIIAEEMELAKTLHGVMTADSRIGFEASNHYYYTANSLMEKVLNCAYLQEAYARKNKKQENERQ